MEKIRFCKRTDSIEHPSCYYKPAEKPVWGDWIDNGTGIDYYSAKEVDALLADVRALVETSRPVLSEFLRWIKNEGGCDHSAGICNCRVINQIAEFDQALAAVEARMKV